MQTMPADRRKDRINEHGVNVSHFARKVNKWAVDESWARGRDVTFLEAFTRWCCHVHPEGPRIAHETARASRQA